MAFNRFESRSARVYENLREMILTGSLVPGEKIAIREMAAKQGTSNGPIRDALLQLSNEKLVEGGSGAEWSVVVPTREMIDGGMVVREAIEVQSARLCAQMATPEDIELLNKLAQRIDIDQKTGSKRDALSTELDGRLHMGIAMVSGSQQLCDEIERWKVVMDWAGLYLGPGREGGDSHVELIKAIATGDADLAGRQMRRHVHHPWDDIKWQIDRDESKLDSRNSSRTYRKTSTTSAVKRLGAAEAGFKA